MTNSALSITDWVPSPAIDHVSSSPRYHPRRSDFPSPVGDLGYCLRSSLPCAAEAPVLAHIHPLRHRFTPSLDVTTILEFVGSKSLSNNASDVHIFREICKELGLTEMPHVLVVADVCREELLFEMDAFAAFDPR